MVAASDLPYLTAPQDNLSMSATPAACVAGAKINGVITSSTNELMILENAAPITTATESSMTFPLMAKALNSFIQDIGAKIVKIVASRQWSVVSPEGMSPEEN